MNIYFVLKYYNSLVLLNGGDLGRKARKAENQIAFEKEGGSKAKLREALTSIDG